MLARITVNGNKVWPENDDWLEIKKGSNIDFGRFETELYEGDIVRFEASMVKGDIPNYTDNKVFWTPVISKGSLAGEESVDIYYGLNEAEVAFFKGIEVDAANNDAAQFDEDFEANTALAEQIKNQRPDNGGTGNGSGSNSGGNWGGTYIPGTDGTPGTPGYWLPGGTGDKVIRRTIITYGWPVWAVVLITVGSVVAAGGAVTLIILKKKGIIGKKKIAAPKGGQ